MVYRLLISLCFIAILSCEKKASDEIPEQRAYIASLDLSERRVEYAKLTPDTKYLLWKDKLNQVINDSKLSQEQMEIILDLRDELRAETFISGSRENKDFKKEFEKPWREKALQVFPFEVVKGIVVSLKDVQYDLQGKKLVPIDEPADDEDCNCSEASDWCGWTPDCEGTCHLTSEFCGSLFLYKCDGVCVS